MDLMSPQRDGSAAAAIRAKRADSYQMATGRAQSVMTAATAESAASVMNDDEADRAEDKSPTPAPRSVNK